MSLAGFDPWAALEAIRAEAVQPDAVQAIGEVSRISRGQPLPSVIAGALLATADTETAVRLDAAIRDGATWAWCPTGALDLVLPDGRLWLLAPAKVARLRAAGLLPEATCRVARAADGEGEHNV